MSKNPNLLIAVVFLIGFLFFWDSFVMRRYGAPRQAQPSATSSPTSEEREEKKLSALADKELTGIPLSKDEKPAPESLTNLTSAEVEVTVHSKGARVVSWKIKERDRWLELVLPEKHRIASPLETFPDLQFSVKKISETQAVWTATRIDGLRITKTLTLLSEPPFHAVTVGYSNTASQPLNFEAAIGWGSGIDKHPINSPYEGKDNVMAEQRAVAFDGQVKRWSPGFIFNRTVSVQQAGQYEWVGVDNNHFLAALIATEDKIPMVRVNGDRDTPPVARAATPLTLKVGATHSLRYQLFVGPKVHDELKKLGHHLDQAVDFGFFGVISKLLLFLLKTFERMTGNYGWAIIILTFVIQLVVFPLTIRSFKHSIRMRELQPQLKKLQGQFKSDPKRLQVETFNLYKKHGMKFMGMEGCLPVLLQIPIFFAFYSTLNVAYELRGAPWIFWIKDLGMHDPYYVLPILMGAGMFLQQKMTAVAMDPAQARMMLFMPVVMTFMFLKLPAGLVLYWCVNSMTTIAVQLFMQKRAASHPSS